MFVAFLDWIRPTDNNAQLCWRFRDVIQRIIDTTFDPPHPPPAHRSSRPPTPQLSLDEVIEQSGQSTVPASMDFLHDISPSWMAIDDLDWLATVDWTQGDWLEPSRQANFP